MKNGMHVLLIGLFLSLSSPSWACDAGKHGAKAKKNKGVVAATISDSAAPSAALPAPKK